jgi:ABC-2 type transport system ATP-binding protein
MTEKTQVVPDLLIDLESVRQLIAQDQIDRATNRLLDLTQRPPKRPEIRNTAIQLTSRWTKISTRQRQIGETSESRSETNELIQQLLEFIDQLERSIEQMPSTIDQLGAAPSGSVATATENRFVQELTRHRLLHQPRVRPDRRCGQMAFDSENVAFRFGSGSLSFRLAWEQFDLHLGEITAVVGPNASGKTTLLRIVGAQLSVGSGRIHYPPFREGSDWYSIKQNIAYIPQSGTPWHGTMVDNLRFEASALGRVGQDNDDDVEFIIHRLRLEAFRDSNWESLSGGYKTRFELARALLREPRLLVLDEPLAHLDPSAQSSFLQDLADITRWNDRPVATIITSQHIHEVEAIADKVVFLNNGRIEFSGATSDLANVSTTSQFEISCSLPADQLRGMLESLAPVQFDENAIFCTSAS